MQHLPQKSNGHSVIDLSYSLIQACVLQAWAEATAAALDRAEQCEAAADNMLGRRYRRLMAAAFSEWRIEEEAAHTVAGEAERLRHNVLRRQQASVLAAWHAVTEVLSCFEPEVFIWH